MNKVLENSLLLSLIILSFVGWYVLFSQNVMILIGARIKYQVNKSQKIDLSKGPCLGTIYDGWALDISHLPHEPIDDLPENKCIDEPLRHVSHVVEMTPNGEIISIK